MVENRIRPSWADPEGPASGSRGDQTVIVVLHKIPSLQAFPADDVPRGLGGAAVFLGPSNQLPHMEEVNRLLKFCMCKIRRLHHRTVGLRKGLQPNLPRPDGLGQRHFVLGVVQEGPHTGQPPALRLPVRLLFPQQVHQGLRAPAGQVRPDLRQRGPQTAEGGNEVIGGNLPGGIVAIAILPHPLGHEQTNVVIVEQGVLLHPTQSGKFRRFEPVFLHFAAS